MTTGPLLVNSERKKLKYELKNPKRVTHLYLQEKRLHSIVRNYFIMCGI